MDIWFTNIHSTKHHYQGRCWIWSEGYQIRLKIWRLWEGKHFILLCIPKHTDMTATGQISFSPVQMGCTRCLVHLVPCPLEQLQQRQLSGALSLEVFDLNPKRPLLKPKDHPTVPSSSAGRFSALNQLEHQSTLTGVAGAGTSTVKQMKVSIYQSNSKIHYFTHFLYKTKIWT